MGQARMTTTMMATMMAAMTTATVMMSTIVSGMTHPRIGKILRTTRVNMPLIAMVGMTSLGMAMIREMMMMRTGTMIQRRCEKEFAKQWRAGGWGRFGQRIDLGRRICDDNKNLNSCVEKDR